MSVYVTGADSGALPTDQAFARSGQADARNPEQGTSYVLPPGYVAGLAQDGSIVAVPIRNAFEAPKPVPAPAMEPNPMPQTAVEEGLSLAVRQFLFYGCLTSLAAGGTVWMIGAGIAAAAPAMDHLTHLLKTAAVFVALVVAGIAALKAKIRTAGQAGGNGATTVAFINRTQNTTIRAQRVIGRGSITNNL